MAMGRQEQRQGDLMMAWDELPRSPGHVFYDALQKLLAEAGFDVFVEEICKPYYGETMGAKSIPPGRYFRMHMIGYFEGIDSERGIEWRCSDSFSLREFLLLEGRDRVPDHSWLSKTRSRLSGEVHEQVFVWVLKLIAGKGLVKGERIGVDASTMEANAALRNIVRRKDGEGYREMLVCLARQSGVETPAVEDLARADKNRKGKKLSNKEWKSASDEDARIARMKDGTTPSISTPALWWRRKYTPPMKATRRRSRRRSMRRKPIWPRSGRNRLRSIRPNASPTKGITPARF